MMSNSLHSDFVLAALVIAVMYILILAYSLFDRTILLSLTAVILAAFGVSESLRLARVERSENVLITFLVSLGLLLLALWLLPRSLLTLKEE